MSIFKTHLDYQTILANRAQPVHFAIRFEADSKTHPRPKPAAFCVVLDRSGSMAGKPLDKAKEAARLAVKNLRPEDLFSLVVEPGQVPSTIYADVMPAVQLPSMTPDIKDEHGNRIQLSMKELALLSDNGEGPAWQSLENLASEYGAWIARGRNEASSLPENLAIVANRHLDACGACLVRINRGIALLRNNSRARKAFKLANLAMLLQQISTKQLSRRPLERAAAAPWIRPQGQHQSPWSVYHAGQEDPTRLGSWRAFQIAFLLMSLEGLCDGCSPDREIVDLIWFPTGGGKTEAYLASMAFYMFHERLRIEDGGTGRRDGTNVLMRYTLRMLTTQQFQRAASLICSMEYLRRNPAGHGFGPIPGERFSLGLWIGGDGSPNNINSARGEVVNQPKTHKTTVNIGGGAGN